MTSFYFFEFGFLILSVFCAIIVLIIHWSNLRRKGIIVNFRQIFIDLTPVLGGGLMIGGWLSREIGFISLKMQAISSITGMCLTIVFFYFMSKGKISYIKK